MEKYRGDKMSICKERKMELIKENKWLPKAIEMLNMRLLDIGFNCENRWLGFHEEYVLQYVPKEHWSGEEYETLNWGEIEIYSKTKVFNPYKFVGGDGYEFEKLTEMSINEEMWEVIKKYIIWNHHQIDNKKIDLHSNPHYERIEFIDGSDVPINGEYE